jgi:large subunit ribosomal protein L10
LTNYGKEFRPQKTFLHHTYSDILAKNRIMLICQHNNMSVPELIQLRTDLAAAGAEMKVIRLGIFAAALRETRYANLAPLVNGPTCVISCNMSPEDEEAKSSAKAPLGLAGIRKVVEKHRKMILLGGKVDDSLVSVEDMEKMVDMPGIQTLRAQVAGLLSQAGGGRLVQLLGMNPTLLVMNLDAHAKSGQASEAQV